MTIIKTALDLAEQPSDYTLGLLYQGKVLDKGAVVSQSTASAPPELKSTGKKADGEEYVAIALDLDAPCASASFLSPLLHWIQPGLKPEPETGILRQEKPAAVEWLAATPPPFSAPHRYLFILFRQSNDSEELNTSFTSTNPGIWPRIRWNADDFAAKNGLKDPIAATYFTS